MLDDRHERFRMVGGTPALDFINTVGGRLEERNGSDGSDYRYAIHHERLDDFAALLEWAAMAGLVTPVRRRKLADAGKGRAGVQVQQRAIALREALFRIFKAAIEGWKPDRGDLELLNKEVAIARSHERLTFAGGRFSLESVEETPDYPLRVVALSAVALLTAPELARVRQCGGDNCGWLFLDTSRNRSRQWCDMRDCGNLAKVRRFRARTQ